jgi:hypothetical protein
MSCIACKRVEHVQRGNALVVSPGCRNETEDLWPRPVNHREGEGGRSERVEGRGPGVS